MQGKSKKFPKALDKALLLWYYGDAVTIWRLPLVSRQPVKPKLPQLSASAHTNLAADEDLVCCRAILHKALSESSTEGLFLFAKVNTREAKREIRTALPWGTGGGHSALASARSLPQKATSWSGVRYFVQRKERGRGLTRSRNLRKR